jgi:hypothetical protein
MHPSLKALALEALRRADGNRAAAVPILAGELEGNAEVLPSLVALGCEVAIDKAVQEGKRRLGPYKQPGSQSGRQAPKAESPPANSLIVGYDALAVSNMRSLLQFPIGDGLTLADAGRDVLNERAAVLAASAAHHRAMSSWCRQIAGKLRPSEVVRDRFAERELRELLDACVRDERRATAVHNGSATLSPSRLAPPTREQLMGAR